MRLGEATVSSAEIAAFLTKEGDEGYRACPHEVLARFLNGMVIYKRGKDPTRPPQPVDLPVTNNVVLKKVRAAFALKDVDIIKLMDSCDMRVSKPELSAFFRPRDHRNYRECGDQFLRYLLKALSTQGPAKTPSG